MGTFTIRNATPQDTGLIYGFILKMARYEKLESEVDTSEEALRRALFDERQAEVVIGEENGIPVGFALFFHNFSTFRGQRGLYLEDLFVDREHRGKGYGKALLLHLTRISLITPGQIKPHHAMPGQATECPGLLPVDALVQSLQPK